MKGTSIYEDYLEFWENHSAASQFEFAVFCCVWLNEIVRSFA